MSEETRVNLFSQLEDKIITAARVAHYANKAYCESLGDFSQKDWEHAEEWQRASSINGVLYLVNLKLAGKNIKQGMLHENWVKEKESDGWVYGEKKDAESKTHPCLVSYNNLPEDQKVKDMLFVVNVIAVVFN